MATSTGHMGWFGTSALCVCIGVQSAGGDQVLVINDDSLTAYKPTASTAV